jgi:hypothetical protein
MFVEHGQCGYGCGTWEVTQQINHPLKHRNEKQKDTSPTQYVYIQNDWRIRTNDKCN